MSFDGGLVKGSTLHCRQIILAMVCKIDQQFGRLETLEYKLSYYNPIVVMRMENRGSEKHGVVELIGK